MALRKRCSPTDLPTLPDGNANPFCCLSRRDATTSGTDDFRVNRRRYRATTETADKQKARTSKQRNAVGFWTVQQSIRRTPDVTFARVCRART